MLKPRTDARKRENYLKIILQYLPQGKKSGGPAIIVLEYLPAKSFVFEPSFNLQSNTIRVLSNVERVEPLLRILSLLLVTDPRFIEAYNDHQRNLALRAITIITLFHMTQNPSNRLP